MKSYRNEVKDMTKKLLAILLAFAMLLAFAGCTGSGDTETTTENTDYIREVKTKVAVADGPMALGLAKLKADRSYAYEVTSYADPQEAAELIKSGKADIAALPVDLAAKLFNETNGGIKILSVINLGYLQVITSTGDIKAVTDLKDKTVYATGEGTAYEYIINYVLSQNGIDPEADVDIQYTADAAELAERAISEKNGIYILPEPYATSVIAGTTVEQAEESTTEATTEAITEAVTDVADAETDETTEYKPTSTLSIFGKALNFAQEWGKLTQSPLAYGCIVARTAYIEANPEIISEFMTFSEVSINYIGANIEQATIFFADNGYFENSTVAYNTLISSNITFLEGDEIKAGVSGVWDVLYQADPALIGGEIPDESIYY